MSTTPSAAPSGAMPPSASGGRLASFQAGFEALRVRNYRLYWIGQIVSMTGTWMQTTAQAWLVLQLTNSPFAIGLVATFQFLPVMLFSLVGGAIADRVPRYRLTLITQTLAMIQAIVFGALIATNTIQLWHVYVLALLLGFINAIDQPVRQSFAVTLVDKAQRPNAIALNSVAFNTSRIIGPALAGLMIAPLGLAAVIELNAASFLAVLIGLLMMDRSSIDTPEARPRQAVLGQIGEGLQYIWRTPDVLLVMIAMAAIGTFGYNFSVTLPLIGGFILHTSPTEYGLLGSALGIGSLLGAMLLAYLGTPTTGRMLLAALLFGVLLGAVAVTTNYLASLAILLTLGLVGVSFTTSANTLIQINVPDALRGRVLSVYMLLFAGSTPVGGLLIGSVSHALGVPSALMVCAILCIVGVVGAWLYRRRTEQVSIA